MKRGNYLTAWKKMQDKLAEFSALTVENWNHYQLLGYMLERTGRTIAPITEEAIATGYEVPNCTNPRNHPSLECVRTVYRQLDKSPEQTKNFLDWCLAKYGSKLNTSGLRSLLARYKLEQTTTAAQVPQRSDPLPARVQAAFQDRYVKTYGDLTFLLQIDRELVVARLAALSMTIEQLHLEKIL